MQLKAVTNHNTLNLDNYIKHALICKKNSINYLPGVEIDYDFEGKDLHAITIFNPANDIIPFSYKLSEIVDYKKQINSSIRLNKHDFAKSHENIEYIFIPNVMKLNGIYPSAGKKLDEAEKWAFSMIRKGTYVTVIFENTKQYHKYSVYAKICEKINDMVESPTCYIGSDFKFDKDVERRDKGKERVKYYISALPTYRGLEISIRNHKTRISHEFELINRKNYLK